MIMIRTRGTTATVTTDRVRIETGDDISIVTTIIGTTAPRILTGDATKTRIKIRIVTVMRTRTEEAMVVTATMVTMVAIAVTATTGTAITTTITRRS